MFTCALLEYLIDWLCPRSGELKFTSVDGDLEVKGNITMVKFEFNQEATFTATPYDRRGNVAQIEAGSAVWSFVGQDADGNDVSDSVVISVDPTNELSAKVRVSDVELTGALSLRADGDPDAGEYAPLIAVTSIVVDASNAVSFDLANTDPVDV